MVFDCIVSPLKMSRLPWVLFVVACIVVCLANAQEENHLTDRCSGANYTSDSLYQKNRITLLSFLSSSRDNSYGFYNFSEGLGTERVNTIALCRGDVTQAECRRCIKFAVTDLPERCPNLKEAAVWYDNCLLRYSNQSIFHYRDINYTSSWRTDDVRDARLFSEALNGLTARLRERASMGDSHVKFAVEDTPYANLSRIYGLVQCTPDLTQRQCSNCLDDQFRLIGGQLYGKPAATVFGVSCNFRYDDKQFYAIPSPPSSLLPPPPPPPSDETGIIPVPPTGGESNKYRNIAIIIVMSAVCFVMLTVGVLIIWRSWNQKRRLRSVDEIGNAEALQLDFETIKAATNNFSDENKLGQGGFGSVYKGKLADGQEIAVKRLDTGSGQGDLEFKNEVVLLAKLQHRNLVRLLGFCLEKQEKLLIYEFVVNASLDRFLFDPLKRSYLDWERRYKIIGGIARGLLYLHEDSRLCIIHRDLKAGNILLDEEMHPKIADFGMARLFLIDETHDSTSRIVGTFGYMAPEYGLRGQFSVKSDVYSFGMLLLELVSGQKNSCFRVGQTVEDLSSYAWDSWRAGIATNIIDPIIINSPRDEIMRCIHIALLCVQESAALRPTMASVVLMLSSFSLSLPIPAEPAFYVHSSVEPELLMWAENSSRTSNSRGTSGKFSKNEISISDTDPR